MLRLASTQPGDRTALGTVDVDRQQLVAIHAYRPRRVELRDDLALRAGELEGSVRRIVGGGFVATALLIYAFGDVRRAGALHRAHFTKGVIEHVPPMTEHVGDDSTAVFAAIIPRG